MEPVTTSGGGGQAPRSPASHALLHEGDVTGVTAGLGVSFNSTLIALSLSILVMFVLHQLQLIQERMVLDTEAFVDERLLRHLHVR